ncbi:glycosyltransferase family 39 protein [Pseudomonas sp. NPDC089534]|uniref:glycosyltransferase family 39 protein n=1 Tax=Pseudomonas sp. NPDC089534 TaxID=3364468 RepID=UPI00382520A4
MQALWRGLNRSVLGSGAAIWLILALAAGLRFYAISLPYLWTDEAFTALVSVQSPSAIWFHMGHDVHPPLYFLMLHVWILAFGDSVLAIRAMSAVAGVVAVALGIWLMRLITTPRLAALAGLFMALLPISVRYGQEARMYALEAVWLLGATLFLVHWLRTARDRHLAGYALLVTAALYTHYLAIVGVLSHFIYLIVLRFQADSTLHVLSRPRLWIAYLAIALAYVPWLLSLVDEVFVNTEAFKTGGEIFWIPESTVYTLPSAIWRFLTLDSRAGLYGPVYLLVPAGLVASALWVLKGDRSRLRFGAMLFIYSFVPLLAVFLASFAFPVFVERYIAFAAIGQVMILALAVGKAARRSRVLAWSAVVLILGLECVGLNTAYTQQDDLDDPRNEAADPLDRIVASIRERSVEGDAIIVHGGYWYYSVAYYSRSGIRPLLYEPAWDATTANRPNGYGSSTLIFAERDRLFLEDLSALPDTAKRVWWVTSDHSPASSARIPQNWRCVQILGDGEIELRLYEVSRGAAQTLDAENNPVRTPPKASAATGGSIGG